MPMPLVADPTARLAAACLAAALCMACAPLPSTPTASAPSDVVAPNDNLVIQGIPPIPASIAHAVARYNDFRGHGFVDWHPTKREMLVSHRSAGVNTTQIFRLAGAAGRARAADRLAADPVSQASYEPLAGDYIVFERSSGGDEAAQLYRLDLATRQTTRRHRARRAQRPRRPGCIARQPAALSVGAARPHRRRAGARDEIAQTLLADRPAASRSSGGASSPSCRAAAGTADGVSWDDRRSR